MNCKELKVGIKDGGVPFIFENVSFCVEDNMLVVDTNTSTYCFPIGNVLYYIFEKQ